MAKNKPLKRNNSKPSRQMRSAYWKVKIQKSSNPYNELYDIKANLPVSLTKEIVAWLQSSSLIGHFLGTVFPRTNREWKHAPIVTSASYDREVLWCCLRLLPYAADIAKFVELAKAFERLFIRAKYEECLVLLDSVEEKFGLSLWLTKRRIHTLQLAEGLEGQKAYAGSLINDPTFINDVIPYLTFYVSYRAESSVSPQRFEALYQESLLEDIPNSEEIHPYLRHHIVSQYYEDTDILAGILNYESCGSFFDYYETLVSTSQMHTASIGAKLSQSSLKILEELGGVTGDDRLFRVVAQLVGTSCGRTSGIQDDPSGYDAFVAGENTQILTIASTSLEDSGHFIVGDLLLFVLASLDSSVDAAWESYSSAYPIIGWLQEMLSGKASKSVRDELFRSAWALEGSVTSHLLRSVIISEGNPVPDKSGSAKFRYSLIGMGKYHPIQSWWTTPFGLMDLMLYNDSRSRTIIGHKCQHACNICSKKDLEYVAKDFSIWECARQLIRKKAYTQVLEHAQRLSGSTHPFYQRQSMIFAIICLMELGEIENCIEGVTDFWFRYPQSSESLPLVRLMAFITPEIKNQLASNISYPILCHIYTIVVGSGEPFHRSYAAEDFLASFGFFRPSQLRDIAGSFPPEKLQLFLHDVCIEQVMDTWIEFSCSEDVALERIEVCKLLTDLFPKNNDVYQREIRGIMRRLTIRKRITEVEKSKIYVDTESVKVVAKRELSEDYERYIAFCSSGMSTEEHKKKVIESIRNCLMSGKFPELLSLKFPRNEMSALLEKMVLYLRAEFMTSSQHGLDGYLSVRIRHGTLEGQLRSAFESEFLLTKKCVETEEYCSNQYWLDRLAYTNPQDVEMANQAFRDFSSEFDQLVHSIKTNWLQIKTKTEDTGRIDFTLLTPEINYIATRITEGTPLDEFLDLVLDYFVSNKLVPSLKYMRQDIQTKFKPVLNKLLTQLQTSIEKIGSTSKIQELRSAIGRARPSGQNTLDRISGWLRLAKTENNEPFLLDEVISISESSVKASCPEFFVSRKIDTYIGTLLLEANLPSFVDIIYLIFDNIVRRSGLPASPQGIVNAFYEEPYLCICVENEVAEEGRTEAKRLRIDEIKEAVRSQPFSKSVSQEGGTGFFKVQKILNHDFSPRTGQLKPMLDFGFRDDNRFYVDVKIPIQSGRKMEI